MLPEPMSSWASHPFQWGRPGLPSLPLSFPAGPSQPCASFPPVITSICPACLLLLYSLEMQPPPTRLKRLSWATAGTEEGLCWCLSLGTHPGHCSPVQCLDLERITSSVRCSAMPELTQCQSGSSETPHLVLLRSLAQEEECWAGHALVLRIC